MVKLSEFPKVIVCGNLIDFFTAHDFNFHYEPSDYEEQMDENVAIRLSFMAKVEETKQMYVSQKISNIKK